MIIRSISDTQPAIYYLLDRKAGRISKIGAAYSRLDPARMAQSRYFTFQSRDGFTLHGRIYLPYGAIGPHPAICLAGSDLTSRARFTFSQLDQLVASRGYAIVKIDHRGTTGFGQRLAEAGDFQIAGTMVDDLADGLQWLVKDGLIDSNRIAILGLNAGGILAIQALAHYPKLFGAWINLSTPMDSSYAEFKQVVFGRYAEEELRSRLGGDKAEREYLHTLDPLAALPKVMAPSFHYYPLNQFDNSIALGGTRIEKFLKKSQIPHVFLKGMAINNFSDFNANKDQKIREERIRIYSEMLRFLDQYLTNKR